MDVTITINGKLVKAKKGEMLLSVIRREGIDVPALCDHPAIEPSGNCRLCTVEFTKDGWDGWKKYVTSCLYPVEEGMIVSTHSQKCIEIGKTILDLQLANSPHSEVIQKLAAEHGIENSSYEIDPEGDNCIMCYACTRICEVLGKNAIMPTQRGHEKVISPPLGLDKEPPDCIGCLSCAQICPTDFIEWTDKNGKRTIWNKTFDLIKCVKCGKEMITYDFASYLIKERNLPANYFEVCDDCKRIETAEKMGMLVDRAKEVSL